MDNIDQNTTSEKSTVKVAGNSCYELRYDGITNRIYLKIIGFWKNLEAVPEYLEDLGKALALVKPNFTVLTDLQKMITHPQELNSLHEKAHRLVSEAGALHVAHVVPEDKIANLQTNSILDASGLKVKNFTSTQEADKWLNQIAASTN
ncbi:hypothetical protein [Pontibacter sp. SGAir0037]|uniref:hypothetical protein n=1 Tax=Pontibacter sp. SGAir0037 TaxID=2571030 RepID=UPI0010CCE601|nr:hypothetical protein [Pontibacter sp. SGAir0037]QCR24008.1 hypothetical protein C1N53_17720 [Pontibacter sp. SGAir0037]